MPLAARSRSRRSAGVIGNMRHAIGRSSYIEQSRDSSSQCGHLKSRLQLAPHEVQPPVKPCLRFRCNARPGTHPIIARRILPRMIVLPGLPQHCFRIGDDRRHERAQVTGGVSNPSERRRVRPGRIHHPLGQHEGVALRNQDIADDPAGSASIVPQRDTEFGYFSMALSNRRTRAVCAAEQTAATQAPRLQPSLGGEWHGMLDVRCAFDSPSRSGRPRMASPPARGR